MAGLRLGLREPPRHPLDLGPLLPERLAGLSARELAAIPLQYGNRRLPLRELFEVTPGDALHLELRGTNARCERIGAGMAQGRIRVAGEAGAYLAQGMRGGAIDVTGSAGPFAGAEMVEGVVRIAHDAGALAGAALPGSRFGMRGGALLVGGRLGDRAGDRMRRGLIVADAAGAHTASRMIGGTIVLRRDTGLLPAIAMRRGTLLLGLPCTAPATFADNGVHTLDWLALLQSWLGGLGVRDALPSPRVRRLTGDLAAAGKGEILIAA